MIKKHIRHITIGLLAGIPNGLFGSGGGMILVPFFCRWLKLPEKKAFATSIAVILPMCIISAIVYLMRRDFSFFDSLPYLVGGLVGGLAGGFLLKKVPTGLLHKIFGAFIIYGGVRSLLF